MQKLNMAFQQFLAMHEREPIKSFKDDVTEE